MTRSAAPALLALTVLAAAASSPAAAVPAAQTPPPPRFRLVLDAAFGFTQPGFSRLENVHRVR